MAEQNGVIGIGDYLPWDKHSGDMQYFKESTTNHIVVMGRKTFRSIMAKPLPNRINIIFTRERNIIYESPRQTNKPIFVNSLDQLWAAITKYSMDKDIWVIGGKQIYELFMPFADEIHTSNIPQSHPQNPKLTQAIHNRADLQVKLDKSFVSKRNKYFKEHPSITYDHENFKVQIYTKL